MNIPMTDPNIHRVGELFFSDENGLFTIIFDPGEKFPFHLVCLRTFTVMQSYDISPTNKEIEADIRGKIIFNNQFFSK